jgi:hypothetical protein
MAHDQPHLSDPLERDRLALFGIMRDAFGEAAERAGGAMDFDYRIGGNLIRLRFAGASLIAPLTRALAHLQCRSKSKPDLVLCLWDSSSTGRPLPLLIGSLIRLLRATWLDDRGIRGEVLEYNSERFRAALHGHDSNMLSLLDLEERLGFFWVAKDGDIPWYETGAPLRTLLYWWFSGRGQQMVHGGAIGTASGGLLLGGKGSSGKSTAALASLDSSLLYAGDDYALVAVEPQPFVHSLYNTAKVKGEPDLKRFPWMAARICNAERIGPQAEKPMMFLHEHQPKKIIPGFPLKAVVLPRFIAGNEGCKIIPVAPASAFKAIAQSTITQLTGAGSEALRAMSQLVHCVPCYLVGLGENLDEIPKTMLELLARHA